MYHPIVFFEGTRQLFTEDRNLVEMCHVIFFPGLTISIVRLTIHCKQACKY